MCSGLVNFAFAFISIITDGGSRDKSLRLLIERRNKIDEKLINGNAAFPDCLFIIFRPEGQDILAA